MKKALICASIACLLAACSDGGSSPSQNITTESADSGDNQISLDTAAVAGGSGESSSNESNRIAGYAVCASIHKAMIALANSKDDGTLGSLIQTNAHQATIYSLAVGDALGGMDGSKRSAAAAAVKQSVDAFMNSNFRGKLLEGAELVRLKNENCDFMNDMSSQANRLMTEYPSDYEEQYEQNKLISL